MPENMLGSSPFIAFCPDYMLFVPLPSPEKLQDPNVPKSRANLVHFLVQRPIYRCLVANEIHSMCCFSIQALLIRVVRGSNRKMDAPES